MEVSLYQAAAAMNATERWQEMISENLATASVPGARKSDISFSAVEAGLSSNGANGATPGYVMPMASTVTNFQQGELHPSGNNLDAALEGPGFFGVETPDGNTVYTRNGQFQINSKSQLVTAQGFPVLGQNGPIRLNAGNSALINISATGEVSQGGSQKGKLQVTEFNKPGLLTALGGGLFMAADPAVVPSEDPPVTHVRQGFVESANSSPTTQMASLITAMRMFESNQKVLQMQSDRMSREISDLGNPS